MHFTIADAITLLALGIGVDIFIYYPDEITTNIRRSLDRLCDIENAFIVDSLD